jgi:hypothetical protein
MSISNGKKSEHGLESITVFVPVPIAICPFVVLLTTAEGRKQAVQSQLNTPHIRSHSSYFDCHASTADNTPFAEVGRESRTANARSIYTSLPVILPRRFAILVL